MIESKDILTVADVAELLQVSGPTVRKLAEEGSIPSLSLGTGKRRVFRFHRENVEAYIKGVPTSAKGTTVFKQDPKPEPAPEPDDQPTLANVKKEEILVQQPEEEEIPLFKTKDMWEAVILAAKGFPIVEAKYDRVGNWWSFLLEDTPERRQASADHFHGQLMVNTKEMLDRLYEVKGIMNRHRVY